MKEIPLSQGKLAIVDDEDYDYLIGFKWCTYFTGINYYAVRNPPRKRGQPRRSIRMHREIMNTPAGMETDHINGNGLDNRRENLRVVTRRGNSQNLHIEKSSKFPGVTWASKGRTLKKPWQAMIRIGKSQKYLGRFMTEEDAHKAYMEAENHSHI
jgi:hypothetical protein